MSLPPKPPVAARRIVRRQLHGTVVEDPYFWLRHREHAEVLDHLEAENAYTEQVTAATQELRETIYRELAGRIPERDEKVPVRRGDFLYGERMVEGAQYPVHWRRLCGDSTGGSLDFSLAEDVSLGESDEFGAEVVLDLEAMAASHDYLSLGSLRISPDQNLAAYTVDIDGSELFRLRVRDLRNGETLEDEIDGVASSCEWGNDSQTLFYVTRDEARRPCRLHRHRLGEPASSDVLLYEEPDERFFLSLEKTRSEKFLVMSLGTHSTTELHVLAADQPMTAMSLVVARQSGIEWQLDHWHEADDFGRFFLCTNQGAANFRLLSAPVNDPSALREEVAERSDVVLDGVECWRGHLVLAIRDDGLSGLEIRSPQGGESHRVQFEEEVGSVSLTDNQVFDTEWLRFTYQSPVTPRSVFDYHMESRERRLRKRSTVTGYRAENYECRRIMVMADDGVEIPVSWVERRGRQAGGPVLLYAYGSYGTPLEPGFSIARLSLLDRGFAYGLVHARGGGEYGRRWYEAAKLGSKPRTFDDVVAVAEHLVNSGFATPRQLMVRGGSAGGLMVGAVINQRPDLFHTALAEVPFVDVLHTMLDPSIPLTVIEFEEWGDPGGDAQAFSWILGYSPYENVVSAAYPHLLVTAGLNDPRVQYWEPAKWVARLRHRKIDDNLLLLRVDMGSGHGGASGRYNSLRQEAFKLAFLVDCQERERQNSPEL